MTAPAVDVTSLPEEDWGIPCEIVDAVVVRRRVVMQIRCKKDAAFTAVAPCCGHRCMSCEPHVRDNRRWWCPECRNEIPRGMNWVRI